MRPTPRVGEAGVLASHGVTSMMDVSDGLALDLSRLCRSERDRRAPRARADPRSSRPRRAREALGGGEDYELLATLPDLDAVEQARSELREAFGVSLSDIGAIIEAKGADGLVAVDEDGTEAPLMTEGTVEGWDHFR